MTPQDKNWLYIGGGLIAISAGIYWYKNKDKGANPEENKQLADGSDTTAPPKSATPTYMPENGGGNPAGNTTSTQQPIKAAPIEKTPDFIFANGQHIMCGVKKCNVLDAQKSADKKFFTKNIVVGDFEFGDEMGIIRATVKSKNGNIYYFVESKKSSFTKSFDRNFFCVNHLRISAMGTKLPTKALANVPTLDNNKVLRRGSKGNEVKSLQAKLGLKQDGDFGKNTEAALLAAKKVKQITLSGF